MFTYLPWDTEDPVNRTQPRGNGTTRWDSKGPLFKTQEETGLHIESAGPVGNTEEEWGHTPIRQRDLSGDTEKKRDQNEKARIPREAYTTNGNHTLTNIRAQELCENRGGLPGLLVPSKPCGFCGRKATLNQH